MRANLVTTILTAMMALAGTVSVPAPATADDNGRVSHVTLYRNQAMVTRTIDIAGDAGTREVVVGELPERVISDSLFAEGTAELEVRAVQFRTRAVGESPREEVRALQEQIQSIQDKLELNRKSLKIAARQAGYLDSLEGFVAPTATTEISQGVLDAEALEQLTRFSFAQREAIAAREIELAREHRDLDAQLQLLNRQLAEISAGASRTLREAVLYLSKTGAGPQTVRLNYLVDQCGWSPNYTIHAAAGGQTAQIDYNGLIHQMSGEDWDNVRITLSTASPALSAAGPGLAPLRVTLSSAGQQDRMQQAGAQINAPQTEEGQLAQILIKQKAAALGNQAAVNYQQFNESNWTLNDAANELACVMLFGDSAVVSDVKTQMEEMADEPSLTYQLETTVSLSSRNNRQMVRIVSSELPSSFYHVATPVLTHYVFREAELTNNSREDLLGGPIMVYLDEKFVGRGEIPTVARGQTFVVGFGADPQLRTHRELVDKTEGINGGNRELKFEYRMVVENFKQDPASIRLVDRMPVPLNGAKIRITRNEFSTGLSDDPHYVRVEKPEGILRWDVDVPASAAGNQARMIEYAYTVEYDRNYLVSLPTSMNQLKEDFERLQRTRTVR